MINVIHKLLLIMLICLFGIGVFYGIFGHGIIQTMYEGKSVGLLNRVITGQSEHSLLHYQQAADACMRKMVLGALVFSGLTFLLTKVRFSKDVLAILFGSYLSLILLFGAEFLLRILQPGGFPFDRQYPDHYYEYNSFGVKTPYEGRHRSFSRNKKDGHLIYDVTYSIDGYGRRITAIPNPDKRDGFILFFGCSFTYGEGVADEQTLPYQVGLKTDRYHPYNYGFHGFGPFDALAKASNTEFRKEIRQGNGIIIYDFIEDHINRTIGGSSTVMWNHNYSYYRKTGDGLFVRTGSFLTGRPLVTAVYRRLGESALLKTLNIGLPLRTTRAHVHFTAQVIEQIQSELKLTYPDAEFLVMIYPGSKSAGRLKSELDEIGIKYLDYSGLFDPNDRKFYLSEEDKHPSPYAYQLIAEQIVTDLKLQ
jgi:hypothetical protein